MSAYLVGATILVAGLVGWRLGESAGGLRPWAAPAWAAVLMTLEGVILAEVGILTPVAWLVTTIFVGLLLILVDRSVRDGAVPEATVSPETVPPGRDTRPVTVLVAGIVLAAVVIVAQGSPMDVRLEGRDPGIYALTAARLDHTGGLDYRDPVVRDLAEDVRESFFPTAGPESLSTSRSMGFYLEDAEAGRVVPQFLPVAPVWLVACRWIVGPADATVAGLVALWLAALSTWALGLRLGGTLAGWLAGILVAANFGAGWFARGGAAEPFAMALVVVGAAAVVESERSGDRRLAALAGLALGLTWLAKLELLLLAGPLALLYAHDLAAGRFRRPATRAFWIASGLLGIHFLLHAWLWSRPYVHDVLLVPGTDLLTVTTVAAVAVIAAVGSAFAVGARGHPELRSLVLLTRPTGAGRLLRVFVLALLLAGLAMGAWVRPAYGGWDADNVIELAWMVSPWILLLAATGLAPIFLDRRPVSGSGRVLVLLLPLATMILYKKQILPHLLWAYRRYLPVILPLVALAAGCAVACLAAWGWRRVRRVRDPARTGLGAGTVVGVLVVAILGLQDTWARSRFYAGITELTGTGALIESLERTFPRDALVLVEPRTRRGLLRFEGVLQHELRRDVLRLLSPDLGRRETWEVILTQIRRDRPVYLLTSGYLVPDPELGAEPVRELRLSSARLVDADGELPTRMEELEIRARVYRLAPDEDLTPLDGELDLGEWDDLYLDGPTMYEVEAQGERRYRWTTPTGRVFLRGLDSRAELLLIDMAAGLPPDEGVQEVTVRLDGREIGTVEVRRGWISYAFELPPRSAPGPLPVLELEVEPPWRPAEVLETEDPRLVGVAVDRIRWGAKPS